MKTIVAIIAIVLTGCMAEQNQIKEDVRVLEIKQKIMEEEIDLTNARMRELSAEIHKCK